MSLRAPIRFDHSPVFMIGHINFIVLTSRRYHTTGLVEVTDRTAVYALVHMGDIGREFYF